MDFRNEYRIVRWIGPATGRQYYACEVKRWWCPVWSRFDFFSDKETAIASCRLHAEKNVVEWLGRLP